MQCALAWAISAFQTLLILSAALGTDPQRSRLVLCSKTGGEACDIALSEPYPAMCSLPRTAWKWQNTGYSIVTEFDLICNRSWLIIIASVFYFAGVLGGCVVWHVAGDTVSYRRLLHLGCIVAGAAGCLSATAPFFWLHIIFRTLSGMGVGGMGVSAYLLASDLAGPQWRPFTGLFLHGGFSVGAALATLLAWVVPSWRWLTLLCALLPIGLTISTWSLLVESPQWLLLRGRKGEATAALAAVAFTNRARPPEYPLADPTAILGNPNRRIIDIIRNPRLRHRSILSGAAWLALTAVYYATVLLSESLSSPDPNGDGTALQIAVTGFAYELPGVAAAALVVERLGRKFTVIGGLLQAGICILVASVTSGDVQRALAVGSRFGMAGGAAALYLLSWELFPVVVQHPGMALLNYTARTGSLVAPALAFAAVSLRSPLVPLIICGSLCLGAAMLVILLPETLGMTIHETIQDLNSAAVKRHRSWTMSMTNVFRPLVGSLAAHTVVAEQDLTARTV